MPLDIRSSPSSEAENDLLAWIAKVEVKFKKEIEEYNMTRKLLDIRSSSSGDSSPSSFGDSSSSSEANDDISDWLPKVEVKFQTEIKELNLRSIVYPTSTSLTLDVWRPMLKMEMFKMATVLSDDFKIPAFNALEIASTAKANPDGQMPLTAIKELPKSLHTLRVSFFTTGLIVGSVIGLSYGNFDCSKYPNYVMKQLLPSLGAQGVVHDDIKRLVCITPGLRAPCRAPYKVPCHVFPGIALALGAVDKSNLACAGQAYAGMMKVEVRKKVELLSEIKTWEDAIILFCGRKYTLLSPIWGTSNPFRGLLTGRRRVKLAILAARASGVVSPVTMEKLAYSRCGTELKESVISMFPTVSESVGNRLIPLAQKLFGLVQKKRQSPHVLENFLELCKEHYQETLVEIVEDMKK